MIKLSRRLFDYYVDNLDPQLLQLQHAAKSTLIGLFCIAIYYCWNLPQPLWLILPGVFVIQSYKGERLRTRIITLLIISCLAVIGVGVFSVLGNWFWLYLTALSWVTFVVFYLRQYGMNITMATIFLFVLLLFAGGAPSDAAIALQRMENAGIAVLIAIAVAIIVLPYRPRKLLLSTLNSNVALLREYISSLFNETLMGKKDYQQTNFFKTRINNRLKQARTLAYLYPDEKLLGRLRRQLTILGQFVALNNLFLMPRSSTAFLGFYQHLKQARDLLLLITDQVGTVEQMQTILQLEDFLTEINKQVTENEDMASFFFILSRLATAFKRGQYAS